MKNKLKKIICLCMVCCVCLLNMGCAQDEMYDVEVKEIEDAMLEVSSGLPEMTTVSYGDEDGKESFEHILDLDYDLLADYTFSYAKEGTAEEIAVLAMKDTNGVIDAKQSLDARITQRKNMYETYAPDEVHKMEKAKIVVKGNYIAYIVSNNPEMAVKTFEKAFE